MADDKAETKQKQQPKKQGLHGWKAATAVFGCGTLAAFGAFGAFLGVAGLFLNFTSTGVGSAQGSSETSAEIIGEPRPSIEPGDVDLCSRNLESTSKISLLRTDVDDNYTDTSGSEEWRISDHCTWDLVPEYNTTQSWSLEYSYDAVISSPEGNRGDVASEEFESRAQGLGQRFSFIESQGESDLAEKSYFVYGEVSPGVSGYILLAQTRSAVYEVMVEAPEESPEGELVPENALYREVVKVVSVSEVEFELWIPGAD